MKYFSAYLSLSSPRAPEIQALNELVVAFCDSVFLQSSAVQAFLVLKTFYQFGFTQILRIFVINLEELYLVMGLLSLNALTDNNSNIPRLFSVSFGEISTCIPSADSCDMHKKETRKSKQASEMLYNQ